MREIVAKGLTTEDTEAHRGKQTERAANHNMPISTDFEDL